MVSWIRGGKDDLDEKFTPDEQFDNGPGLNFHYLQRMALKRMRLDPIVTERFHPGAKRGLEFLQFDGDPVGISVLIKKAHIDQKGRVRTRGHTDQQLDRRRGQLPLNGVNFIPLVLSYLMKPNLDYSWRLMSIFIGSENLQGFEWMQPLWKDDEEGGELVDATPPTPLFPQETTKITLRVPIPPKVVPATAVGIGVEQKRELERQRKERERKAKDRA